jgi:hypothetical protein
MYDRHLISSSHAAQFNLGYEKEYLPEDADISATFRHLSFSFGYDIGGYLGQLGEYLSPSTDFLARHVPRYGINDKLIKYRDVKSERYYLSVFNGPTSKRINFSLSLLLYALNYLQYILGNLMAEDPDTSFRMKFVTLYHVASSLRQLQNYLYPQGVLTDKSKECFKRILSDKELKRIISESNLRNVFVHYRIDKFRDEDLDLDTRMYGLIEASFNNHSFTSLDELLDRQIARVSRILEEWLEG